MKKITNWSLIIFLWLSIFSFSPPSEEFNFLELDIGQVAQNFYGPNVISYDDASRLSFISFKSDTLDASAYLLELTLNNRLPGTYIIGDSINEIALIQHLPLLYNDSTVFYSAVSGTVVITVFDTVQNRATGSFSGILQDYNDVNSLSILSSTFSVMN